jgi:hypothetical protein
LRTTSPATAPRPPPEITTTSLRSRKASLPTPRPETHQRDIKYARRKRYTRLPTSRLRLIAHNTVLYANRYARIQARPVARPAERVTQVSKRPNRTPRRLAFRYVIPATLCDANNTVPKRVYRNAPTGCALLAPRCCGHLTPKETRLQAFEETPPKAPTDSYRHSSSHAVA